MTKNSQACPPTEPHVFWGEIAPCNNSEELQDPDASALDWLESFVRSGFKKEESVIVIATKQRLENLYARLLKRNDIDIKSFTESGQFLQLDAEETIAEYMVNGWPDEKLFLKSIKNIVNRSRGKDGRNVRAYSEQIASIWGQGHGGCAVRLEYLWQKLVKSEPVCIFCAFPKTAFTQSLQSSIKFISVTHSAVSSKPLRPAVVVYSK